VTAITVLIGDSARFILTGGFMTELIQIRGQMQTVSKTAVCSIDFLPDDKVQLWWVDGEKSYNAILPIYGLDMTHKRFREAFKQAKRVMR